MLNNHDHYTVELQITSPAQDSRDIWNILAWFSYSGGKRRRVVCFYLCQWAQLINPLSIIILDPDRWMTFSPFKIMTPIASLCILPIVQFHYICVSHQHSLLLLLTVCYWLTGCMSLNLYLWSFWTSSMQSIYEYLLHSIIY